MTATVLSHRVMFSDCNQVLLKATSVCTTTLQRNLCVSLKPAAPAMDTFYTICTHVYRLI